MATQQKALPAFNALDFAHTVNTDAERFILGSVLLDDSRFPAVFESVKEADFGLEKHRRIYRRMIELHQAGEKIDRVTLANHLLRYNELESVDGLSYLVSLDDGLPWIANLESYIGIIRKLGVKRRALETCNALMVRLASTAEEEEKIFGDAEASFQRLSGELVDGHGFVTPAQVVQRAGGMQKYFEKKTSSGIPYPWPQMNRMTGGMQDEQLIVVAGPTSKGKSKFAMNIGLHVGSFNMAVPIYSQEMSDEELCDSAYAVRGRFDSRILRRPYSNQSQEAERISTIASAAREVNSLPIFLNDTATCTVPMIEASLARLVRSRFAPFDGVERIGCVIVDYIQLMDGVGKFDTRANEIGTITRGLKRIARRFKCPVIALSQFNNDPEKEKREPELRDLKESSSIKQDANSIFMIHFTEDWDVNVGKLHGFLKLLARKNRGGPTGYIDMGFHAPSGWFYELEDAREAA